jgi:hypothetical protein
MMKVYTVTIIDDGPGDSGDNNHHMLRATQHRRTSVYNRYARAVNSAVPPTIDIRL